MSPVSFLLTLISLPPCHVQVVRIMTQDHGVTVETKPLPAEPVLTTHAATGISSVPLDNSTAASEQTLPSSPETLSTDQHDAVKETRAQGTQEENDKVDREMEKHRGAIREVKGHQAQGTVVPGIEDDRLWAMFRRFNNVSRFCSPASLLFESNSLMRSTTASSPCPLSTN